MNALKGSNSSSTGAPVEEHAWIRQRCKSSYSDTIIVKIRGWTGAVVELRRSTFETIKKLYVVYATASPEKLQLAPAEVGFLAESGHFRL